MSWEAQRGLFTVPGVNPTGKTALMYAAMFDLRAVIELLLARGASTELKDSEGRTALDYARAKGAHATADLLEQRS